MCQYLVAEKVSELDFLQNTVRIFTRRSVLVNMLKSILCGQLLYAIITR